MIDLNGYQTRINEWACRNFGSQTTAHAVLGMTEELGEVARALVKRTNGVRPDVSKKGTVPHEIGDVIVFALQALTCEGVEAESVLEQTFQRILSRDWVTYPVDGGECW